MGKGKNTPKKDSKKPGKMPNKGPKKIYVHHMHGNDSDNGSSWVLAKETLTNALNTAITGDIIYVHADTKNSYS
jgi:hypothetical protein